MFKPHKIEEVTLEKHNIEADYKNLISKSLDIGSYVRDSLLRYTPQIGQLESFYHYFCEKLGLVIKNL